MVIENKSKKSILIIGAGVAGISAALDAADQGQQVYLVERTPSIGGKMSQLDKTFPTLDCSICILAPKMVECARHPNIELMTYSEIKEVTPIQNGDAFKVKILLKPRYIDASKCTSCGTCASKCPSKKTLSEFEVGLTTRTAAYIPFLQAVPSVYLIDKDNCIFFKKGKCKACEKFCPSGAIDFEQQPKEIEVEVASIIIATGFDLMDPSALKNYGYKKYSNVVISLEYERIMCASGPTKGDIVRLSDNGHPHKIAFVLCVGSRNVGLKPYCSKICCMYATKEAIMTMEHHPEAEILVYYNDLRAIGKGHDEFIERAKDEYKVNYIKGLPSHIFEDPETNDLVIRHTDFSTGRVKSDRVNMAVLFPAVIPSKGLKELSEILGVKTDEFGFIKTKSSTNFIETSVPGIYTCGCAQGPEDISTSVAQASGAAAKAAGRTAIYKAEETVETIPEIPVLPEDNPRIGVFLCHCGTNIAGVVDMEKLEEAVKILPNIVYVERNLYTCSEESQISIKSAIEEHDLNRVVIASCTPRTHLPLFQATCKEAGLNQYLVSFASIRELVSWVHMSEPEKATDKAQDQVQMAVARAGFLEPLYDTKVDVIPAALIVGGGIAGMTAALSIAKKGFKVYIIEKEESLGGLVKTLNKINLDRLDANQIITPMIQAIKTNKNITICTSGTVKSVDGAIGNFDVTVTRDGIDRMLKIGVIIVAVGAEEFKPNGYYSYKDNENVYTSLEFVDIIRNNQIKDGETIIFIQCVGSREKDGRPYCSLTCCANSIKNALLVKDSASNSQVFILYRDVRVTFEEEEYYRKAREKGINFIKYNPEQSPKLESIGNKLLINVFDQLKNINFELSANRVVLATPLIAWKENKKLSEMLKVPLGANGFFFEAHPKLRPVDFATDGIFVCGTAQGPKNISESISQALGAASRALIPLMRAKAKVMGATAKINTNLCSGCGICIKLCPYSAITRNEENELEIKEVLCKGCGVCGASCTQKAISIRHFTNEQILAEIIAFGEEQLVHD